MLDELDKRWPTCEKCGKPMIKDVYLNEFYCTCQAESSLWKMRLERDLGKLVKKEVGRMSV